MRTVGKLILYSLEYCIYSHWFI